MKKETNMDAIAIQRQNKAWASVSTVLLMGLLLLLIFMITIQAPNPPFEESGNPGPELDLATNFGITNEGMGDNFQPDQNNQVTPPAPPDDNVITDDSPDNVPIKNDPKNTNDQPKEPQPDKNLQNAFNNFNDSKGGDGNTDKPGDQGDPNGGDSKNYDGNAPTGNGGGNGIVHSLTGRNIKVYPPVITKFDEDGIIVVEIIVDKNGKVTFAEVNRAKSTNPNFTLCSYARQQALQTTFTFSDKKGDEQKGTITFKYIRK
jgi:periplasmic protein TonB